MAKKMKRKTAVKKVRLTKKTKNTASTSTKNSGFVTVYITAPDRDVALKMAQTLVEEKLAACFNIFENITSVYTWKNELEKSTEVALIGKTQSRHIQTLTQRAKELNTYEVPCITFWPILSGLPLYLEWIRANTK